MTVKRAGGPDPARSRLTMGDLAQLAGVSAITISRALKNSDLVRPAVREKIQSLAAAHGYRLNTAARNLRLRRNHSITAVVNMTPSADRPISDPIFLALVGGLLQVSTDAGCRLILTNADQLLSSRNDDTDGIIFLGQGSDDAVLREVNALGLPFVVWGAPREEGGGWLTIGSDNVRGGRSIGEHLTALGRKQLLFLGDPAYPEVADRLSGLRSATAASCEITVIACPFGRGAGMTATAQAMTEGWRGDAVVGASDTLAMGAMTTLLGAGLHIPHHVAVVGFDDIPAAATAPVPLTTVRQDWDKAGALLGTKLLQWVAGERPGGEMLPISLVERASTIGMR